MNMRIALDAMGGDAAPAAVVEGAIQAVQAFPDVVIQLVGDEGTIRRELARLGVNLSERVHIVHASQRVDMGERPVEALKRKPDSSILKSVELVACGRADAAVSAGNTGAMVAASLFALKRLRGVKRPGIAINVPTATGRCTIIDVGANVECKPIHLYQYGVMASIYTRHVVGCANPRVGILSVGEEEEKGNTLVKDTRKLFEKSTLNFIGNVEGRDAFSGACDVMVCDGFVGNVLLKVCEGFAERILGRIYDAGRGGPWMRLGLNLLRPLLDELRHLFDFAEYGGAPLLGVDGITIISHGRSDARAIKNAVGAARRYAEHNVNQLITDALAHTRTVMTTK